MKVPHTLSADISRHRSLRILLVGCGGNGRALLFGLPYLHHALIAWGRGDGLDVTAIDGDTVSPTNCVRQPFGGADIGLNKATLLVNRVNLFHGLCWSSVGSFFSKQLKLQTRDYEPTVDFLISCVDTRAARRELHESLQTREGPWRNVRYWLDLGNGASSGQFVLGQPLNGINRRSKTRLRTVTELFPSIMDTSEGEGSLPSCSAAEALDRQEPFINNVLATSALAMLTRLLRYGSIDHHGAFYNAASGRSVPMPSNPRCGRSPAAFARPRRRRRRHSLAPGFRGRPYRSGTRCLRSTYSAPNQPPPPTWSSVFTPARRGKTNGGWKNTSADIITWHGIFAGRVVTVLSTVRLVDGNMAHFTVSSNARIGGNHSHFAGGHFVDLLVSSRFPLSDKELLALGRLAQTEEERRVTVRRAGSRLADGVSVARLAAASSAAPNRSC